MDKNEIILYETSDHSVKLNVNADGDTVWLSMDQLTDLFERDKSTISRHIRNVFKEGELERAATVAKFATVQTEGDREITRYIEYYNLDVIISVGYRVKSQRGVEFRKWANKILKDYIINGYAVNNKRIEQIGEVIRIMKRAEKQLEVGQVLSVIEKFNAALDLLDDYDHQTMKKPTGSKAVYVLDYEECRKVISEMKFASDSELFGNEKDDSFKGSIANIYQEFGGVEIYPSLEEKAANLLYFVTKNHSFSDGNKRIAAAMFLYFLDKNNALFLDDAKTEKTIADQTLAALTIMIAESQPSEKEMMINVIMNCMVK
ncbi:virulence protein RhuM/Fic/DOC family protein [Ruminococcus sp.]|jgi:prophage maintenance system killer protein|uniref:virulence protein RhuM/Fic/DOC family protein n=1 Tax=Ruminococcus sp. TaxID=41978 RepID=UPI0025F3F6B5|nr:virulence protein RhuM/Fic/DOC family protein [Ruminococcus sp.]